MLLCEEEFKITSVVYRMGCADDWLTTLAARKRCLENNKLLTGVE